ncbi:hypothetical protein BT63DRAFT_461578 [Microthyrium microscopicum]|uniref:Uncharacterized protein n=1 Tax=Microthyrium microscopicum TaxID=703497 RepID=A0A6A6TVJ3_9PEZI|nr:hypothetical protein BT63DRAFT_461578 [Microthyrium microscopicum]
MAFARVVRANIPAHPTPPAPPVPTLTHNANGQIGPTLNPAALESSILANLPNPTSLQQSLQNHLSSVLANIPTPQVPNIPQVTIPQITVPQITVNIPQVTIPNVNIPGVVYNTQPAAQQPAAQQPAATGNSGSGNGGSGSGNSGSGSNNNNGGNANGGGQVSVNNQGNAAPQAQSQAQTQAQPATQNANTAQGSTVTIGGSAATTTNVNGILTESVAQATGKGKESGTLYGPGFGLNPTVGPDGIGLHLHNGAGALLETKRVSFVGAGLAVYVFVTLLFF